MSENKALKPLGGKAYGSIPHLPESKRGPGDHGIDESYARCFYRAYGKAYRQVRIQSKLDGSCCVVARTADGLVPMVRRGYPALSSPFLMHHVFHYWVMENEARFMNLLKPGERAAGEWLMQAHGTRYKLETEPFVLFDILEGNTRNRLSELEKKASAQHFVLPHLIHSGYAIPFDKVLELIGVPYHGELDAVEGAVFRLENKSQVLGLAKYVQPQAEPGRYMNLEPPVLNWTPPAAILEKIKI